MRSARYLLAVLILLLLFPACIRKQSSVSAAGTPGEGIQMPAAPSKPGKDENTQAAETGQVPAESRREEEPVPRSDTAVMEVKDPAFFAVRDKSGPGGYRGHGTDGADYDIGPLSAEIPDEISSFLDSLLVGDFPEDSAAPAWRDHLARQFLLFPRGANAVFTGRIEEKDGNILAPFKIIRDNQFILGSLWAEMDQEGKYRIQDITMDQVISAPFSSMDFPLPAVSAFPGG